MVAEAPVRGSRPLVDLAPPVDDAADLDPSLLFDGFVAPPAQTAAVLLLLGRVARHRFHTPPGLVARMVASDPVVTTSRSRLRFESFSLCGGVALRLDVHPEGLDHPPARHGTTNIDLTGPTRLALTGVQGNDPLHLRISTRRHAAVTFTTLDHAVTEERAALPPRWIRGFAEAQASGVGLVERARITSNRARELWRTLPPGDGGTSSLHVVGGPTGGLRLTGTPSATAVPVGGPSRLRILEPLLRYATTVAVYGPAHPDGPGVSLWQLDLPGGTLSCALSPTSSRGFSGEGGLLHQLAGEGSEAAGSALADHLDEHHGGDRLDPDALADAVGLDAREVTAGLAQLAAVGRLGFDAREGAYFHRELPWRTGSAEALNPRLRAARRLAVDGDITMGDPGSFDVRHGTSHHRVTLRGDGPATCTCPWIAQHGSSRGPCKHILAVSLTHADDPGATP